MGVRLIHGYKRNWHTKCLWNEDQWRQCKYCPSENVVSNRDQLKWLNPQLSPIFTLATKWNAAIMVFKGKNHTFPPTELKNAALIPRPLLLQNAAFWLAREWRCVRNILRMRKWRPVQVCCLTTCKNVAINISKMKVSKKEWYIQQYHVPYIRSLLTVSNLTDWTYDASSARVGGKTLHVCAHQRPDACYAVT